MPVPWDGKRQRLRVWGSAVGSESFRAAFRELRQRSFHDRKVSRMSWDDQRVSGPAFAMASSPIVKGHDSGRAALGEKRRGS